MMKNKEMIPMPPTPEHMWMAFFVAFSCSVSSLIWEFILSRSKGESIHIHRCRRSKMSECVGKLLRKVIFELIWTENHQKETNSLISTAFTNAFAIWINFSQIKSMHLQKNAKNVYKWTTTKSPRKFFSKFTRKHNLLDVLLHYIKLVKW